MHELSITQSMVDLVLDEARKAEAARVKKISLVIGEMSGIVDDCVQFYFELISKDTIASEATLSFKKVPVEAHCRNCGEVFTPEEFDWSCPRCHNTSIEIKTGNELYVESIEVE